MDRGAIAREGRRAQALEALTFEREREEALRAQLTEVVLEDEGGRVDAEAFARMSPDDVTRVREALGAESDNDPDDEEALDDADVTDDDEGDWGETEIRRLQGEIERSRARQHALEYYVEVLARVS